MYFKICKRYICKQRRVLVKTHDVLSFSYRNYRDSYTIYHIYLYYMLYSHFNWFILGEKLVSCQNLCSNLLYMLYIYVQTNQTIDIGGWERKREKKSSGVGERGSIVWISIQSYMFWPKHWLEPLKNSKRLSFRKKMAQICSPQRTMYMYVFVIYK